MFRSTLANGTASLLLSVYVENTVGLYSIFKLHHRNESLHFLLGENNLHDESCFVVSKNFSIECGVVLD